MKTILILSAALALAPARAARAAEPEDLGAAFERVSRATVPMYDPAELRFEAVKTALGKGVRVYEKDRTLATLEVGGALIGWHVCAELVAVLEARRQLAIDQGRIVSLDRRFIAEFNATGYWGGKADLEKPENFGKLLRIHDHLVAEDL